MRGSAGRITHRIEERLRGPARTLYLSFLRRAAARAEPPPAGTAIVFAPHPDDETLACGGTIAARRAAGFRVVVVVMTDGAASHPGLISGPRLKAIRATEALSATSTLGLPPDDVIFLEYPDGELASFEPEAIARVRTIIGDLRPRLVFAPYQNDIHPDHEATNAIVHAALASDNAAPLVFEYPVWYLHHWPLVDESPRGRVPVLSTLRWGALLAARTLRAFRSAVDVRPFLDRKRAAMACYRSQTTRLIDDPHWLTLADFSDGEFLALFFRDYEPFRRVDVHLPPAAGKAKAYSVSPPFG